MKINVGCGKYPLLYYVNIDNDPSAIADTYVSVPPLPYGDGELDEVYAGHFLEHLQPEEADEFLNECWRCLKPGGKLGIVVPDTRAVMEAYLGFPTSKGLQVEYPLGHWNDPENLDDVCALFLYSTLQESPHKWSYDSKTLRRKIESNNFQCTGEINRWMDRRIPVGNWYQCGWDAVKV